MERVAEVKKGASRLLQGLLALALISATTAILGAAPALAGDTNTFVTSFDGTRIHVWFFTAAGLRRGQRAPTVLEGPGFGGTATTNPNAPTIPSVGIVGVGPLRRAGYNVVTWDPRGFGDSGGAAQIDSPQYEGRDVTAIINWLAGQPQALLDGRNDPRVGMVGGSYGGGIQLAAAEVDRRIDVITPDIAWNSLTTSLDKADTIKTAWSQLLILSSIASHQRNNPLVTQGYQESLTGFTLTPGVASFFATRGPANLLSRIHIPTLLLEGTVDTLFTLQEAVNNYNGLRRNRIPLKMVWFCGGHGVCLTNPGNASLIQSTVLNWLERYLKRNPNVNTGPGFMWLDQRGREYSVASYPPKAARALSASGRGTLQLKQADGSGPYPARCPASASSPR